MRLKPVLIFFLFATISNAIMAIEKQTCIAPSTAAVSEILPGMNESILNRTENYITVTTTIEEDDGGDYEARKYHYAQYDITTVRGIIDSIRITSPDILWAKKIKIGTERKLVENHIISLPVSNEKNGSQYVVCSNVGDVYAIFQYYKNKVKSIKIVIDRP